MLNTVSQYPILITQYSLPMCGIAGAIAFSEAGKKYPDRIGDAVAALRHRGPDGEGTFRDGNVALGHTRLAIIDTSDNAAQPFTSTDGRYTIVFNGEIFNYRELRAEMEKEGVKFRTQSDTEVLLALFAKEGKDCLPKLNGFFAFAVYDKNDGSLFLARDRYGEKPLYWMSAGINSFCFASEPAALLAFGMPSPPLNRAALTAYLHLNYVPENVLSQTMFGGMRELNAGNFLVFPNPDLIIREPYYKLPSATLPVSYDAAQRQLREKLEKAVERRLVADVPLGAFLSGGLDSSIISALAVKQKASIDTFSIGFADEPFFDETEYAKLVSKHLGTKHHVFSLTNNDLLESLHEFLAHCDEPFADSSALAVNILAKETKRHVTVALSGDGADELFAGYNKHEAELRLRQKSAVNNLMRHTQELWQLLPASRNSAFGNRVRQLRKFTAGLNLSPDERYWRWAGFTQPGELKALLADPKEAEWEHLLRKELTEHIRPGGDFNEVLRADMKIVLEGDMLVKVDRMSMLHGLEVRPPFLDHEVVDFVMQLPAEFKIQPGNRKRILKDTFRDLLPAEIFTRRKQGFEVPLLKWFRNELRGLIDELLDEKFLKEQQLFHTEAVKQLRKQLHSSNPGDSAARIWGLIVFQSWWKKYCRKGN